MSNLTTIRSDAKKKMISIINKAAVVAVYRVDGYYPMPVNQAIKLVEEKGVDSCLFDTDNERLTCNIKDRKLGRYITTFPSVEAMKKQLFNKDAARLDPTNEMHKFASQRAL